MGSSVVKFGEMLSSVVKLAQVYLIKRGSRRLNGEVWSADGLLVGLEVWWEVGKEIG